jgi:hypothetical protein
MTPPHLLVGLCANIEIALNGQLHISDRGGVDLTCILAHNENERRVWPARHSVSRLHVSAGHAAQYDRIVKRCPLQPPYPVRWFQPCSWSGQDGVYRGKCTGAAMAGMAWALSAQQEAAGGSRHGTKPRELGQVGMRAVH